MSNLGYNWGRGVVAIKCNEQTKCVEAEIKVSQEFGTSVIGSFYHAQAFGDGKMAKKMTNYVFRQRYQKNDDFEKFL